MTKSLTLLPLTRQYAPHRVLLRFYETNFFLHNYPFPSDFLTSQIDVWIACSLFMLVKID